MDAERAGAWREGMRAGLPLAAPMLLIGTTFGVAARHDAGWGVVAPIVMSLITFGGAAQIALMTVLAAHGSLVTAVVAGALVNLRFLPVGIAIGPWLSGGPLRRALTGQAIVDASLLVARDAEGRYGSARLLGSTVPQWLGWQLGTIVGVVAAGALSDPGRLGIDALFPAFFLVLLMREVSDRASAATAAASGVAVVALAPVAPAGVPVVAACGTVVVGALLR